MQRNSKWWGFLLAFAIVIGSIQSLGWYFRPSAAQAQSTRPANDTMAAKGQTPIEAQHWRSLVMQQ